MSRPRHVPQRTCVACRQARPKAELLRIVRTPEDGVRADPGGKAPGRGAYVCRNATCPEQAVKQKKLSRALGVPVDEALLEEIARISETSGN